MQLVILDRDGVINQDSDDYIKSPAEWHALPGSLAAIAKLNRAGFRVVIATNQSGIGRGLYDEATLEKIHQKLQDELARHHGMITKIYYCPHAPTDKCDCRKPKPGLLQKIATDFNGDLTTTYFVGDSQRDLDAALAVGAKPILVLTGNGKVTQSRLPPQHSIAIADNLAAAVDTIILPS